MSIPTSYSQARDFLGDRISKRIRGIRATRIEEDVAWDTGETIYSLYYHNTPVVVWFNDGSVKLNTRGYYTVTTKRRINEAIRGKGYVFQHKHEWYYQDASCASQQPFVSGMIINKLEAFR